MYLANTDLGGYVPPGYNKLRTTLLQQWRVNVEKDYIAYKRDNYYIHSKGGNSHSG